jgi:hypothetical protein
VPKSLLTNVPVQVGEPGMGFASLRIPHSNLFLYRSLSKLPLLNSLVIYFTRNYIILFYPEHLTPDVLR